MSDNKNDKGMLIEQKIEELKAKMKAKDKSILLVEGDEGGYYADKRDRTIISEILGCYDWNVISPSSVNKIIHGLITAGYTVGVAKKD